MSWHDFLSPYGEFIWASDLFTVTTATLRTYYVLFVIDIGSRKIRLCNVTEHPNEDWEIQQFRNLAIVHDDLPRHWDPMGPYKELREFHLIHDRDSKFTVRGDDVLRQMGTKPLRLPHQSPDLNSVAERWVLSARSECLDHVIILNERHLRWALDGFVRYYNERRPHRGKGLRLLSGDHDFTQVGEVARRPVLGGLTNDYYRKAA